MQTKQEKSVQKKVANDAPIEWTTQKRKVSDLVPHKTNPRQMTAKQTDDLTKSLRKFNLVEIPAINTDGTILAGHQRLRIMQAIGRGAETIDVRVPSRKLTDAEAREYLIRSNRNTGDWDWDALANAFEMKELKEWGFEDADFDIGPTGEEQAGDANPQVERADELKKKWNVKTGDLWLIGSHRLVCGDSTKIEDMTLLMGKDLATCVFTDPPYGVSIGKKNEMLNTFQPSGRCLTSLGADDMKPDELKVVLLSAFKNARKFMSDDCSVFVCSPQGGGLGMMMMMMMKESGLEVRHILNWIKNSPTFSMGRLDYDYQHEPILFTWTKTHKRKKKGQWQTSLWAADKPRACKEHPTMKPVELPINAILNHTDEKDIVLDMFGGSGTTMVAAQNTGRSGRMIELSPGFAAVIIERMATAFPGIDIRRGE